MAAADGWQPRVRCMDEEMMGSEVRSWKERWGTGLRFMLTFRHRASFPVAVL